MPSDKSTGVPLGRSHPLVKRIRVLSRSSERRAIEQVMIAEGIRLASEALAEGVRVLEAVFSPRLLKDERGARLLAALRRAGVTPRQAADALLDSLHDADSHQGILLVIERPGERSGPDSLDLSAPRAAGSLLLVACGVQDPGNTGALVRLADACGAAGFIAVGGADPFGPKAVRASAGSIFRLPVQREADMAEAPRIADRLWKAGFLRAGAAPRGGRDYRDEDLSRSLALFVGAEGAGLPPAVDERLDLRLSIPMNPKVESINVSAAAAILLFAASSQMGLTSPRRSSHEKGPPHERPRRRAPRSSRSGPSDPEGA
jgi:TrmH family RNA methyltransferase